MLWVRPSFAEKTALRLYGSQLSELIRRFVSRTRRRFLASSVAAASWRQSIRGSRKKNSYLYSFCDKKDAVEISALDLFTDDPDLRDMNEHLIVQEQAGLLSSTFNESSELSPHVSPNISACSDDIGERLVFCLLFFNYCWFRIFMNEGLQALHKTRVRSGKVTFGELLL